MELHAAAAPFASPAPASEVRVRLSSLGKPRTWPAPKSLLQAASGCGTCPLHSAHNDGTSAACQSFHGQAPREEAPDDLAQAA